MHEGALLLAADQMPLMLSAICYRQTSCISSKQNHFDMVRLIESKIYATTTITGSRIGLLFRLLSRNSEIRKKTGMTRQLG